jgi:hypothetical protein
MSKLVLAIFGVVFTAVQVLAQIGQTSTVPLPKPLVCKPPASGKWETTYLYGKGGQGDNVSKPLDPSAESDAAIKADPRNRKTVTEKIGERETEEAVLSDGRKVSRWRRDGIEVVKNSDSPTPAINVGHSSGASFSGLEWISAKSYRGVQELDGRMVHVFEDEVPLSKQMRWYGHTYIGDAPNVTAVAKIEVKSFLPVSISIGDETRRYRYFPVPALVAIPSEIDALITEVIQKNNVKVPQPPQP